MKDFLLTHIFIEFFYRNAGHLLSEQFQSDNYQKLLKENQRKIMEYLNNLKPNFFTSYDGFRKWLIRKAFRYSRKLNNTISKVAYEYLTISRFPHPPITERIRDKYSDLNIFNK